MTSTASDPRVSVVLVPGYWLGAWAWDVCADRMRELGLHVEAFTLPGLESEASGRSSVTFADHVDAVAERVQSVGSVVLVAHSGAGAIATAVTDRLPDAVTRVIYVDSGPVADGHVPQAELPEDVTELPFPGFDALAQDGVSAEGMTESDRSRVEELAVPQPAGPSREPVRLKDPRRNAVPTTLICCSIPSDSVREMAGSGEPMFAPLNDLTDLTLIDLPTGHWPMLSRPVDLADVIAEEAARA